MCCCFVFFFLSLGQWNICCETTRALYSCFFSVLVEYLLRVDDSSVQDSPPPPPPTSLSPCCESMRALLRLRPLSPGGILVESLRQFYTVRSPRHCGNTCHELMTVLCRRFSFFVFFFRSLSFSSSSASSAYSSTSSSSASTFSFSSSSYALNSSYELGLNPVLLQDSVYLYHLCPS